MISRRERRKWEGLFRRELQGRTGVWGDEGFLLAEDWRVYFLVGDADTAVPVET